MEGELFAALYRVVEDEARRVPRPKHVRYSDALVLLVVLWAALHDRPVSWACRGRELGPALRLARAAVGRDREPAGAAAELRAPARRRRRRRAVPARAAAPELGRAAARPLCRQQAAGRRGLQQGPRRAARLRVRRDRPRVQAARRVGRRRRDPRVVPPRAAEPQRDDAGLAQVLPSVDGPGYLLADALHDGNALHRLARERGLQLVARRARRPAPDWVAGRTTRGVCGRSRCSRGRARGSAVRRTRCGRRSSATSAACARSGAGSRRCPRGSAAPGGSRGG
jgi:hypothetical protein